MANLTKDRHTQEREGIEFNHPVAAGVQIFAGAIVVLDGNLNAAPATTATGLIALGRAEEMVDNRTGNAGDVSLQVRTGTFSVDNDGTVARANIGALAYVVDDHTVADNDGGGSRSVAGKIVDVDLDGVWVTFS